MTPLLLRRLIFVSVAIGLIVLAYVGYVALMISNAKKQFGGAGEPPATVTITAVAMSDWQPETTAIGSLRAVRGVDVTTEVAGLVRTLNFRSGDSVKAGALLVELNSEADVAQLAALQSAAALAEVTYRRDEAQIVAHVISKAQFDADKADLENRRALAAAQAALVAKKTLRAPFAGRLGITTVNPGQYLNPGDKVVTLQALEPILVDFRLPQQELGHIAVGQTLTLSTDTYPGREFKGRIDALDSKVDAATRNFSVEATVANAERLLLPGMYGRIAVATGTHQRSVTVPQTALAYSPYGTTVFIARPDPKSPAKLVAAQTFVTPGPTRGDQVAITKGLDVGEQIVTSGQLKLHNGTPLLVNNELQPKSDAQPTPQER